jgi:hypothetical protein
MKFTPTGALLAVLALILAATAEAEVIVFTDEGAFLAHTQAGFYRETFTSLPDGPLISPQNFSNDGFAYEATSLSDFIVRSRPPVKWLSPTFVQDSIVIPFHGWRRDSDRRPRLQHRPVFGPDARVVPAQPE